MNESTEKCDLQENFADDFKAFRARAGLQQRELAALLDIHPNYISQIERNEKAPGKRLVKDFRTLESSPVYQSTQPQLARESQSMPPPHYVEYPERSTRPEVPNVSEGDPTLTHQDFVTCMGWLSELFDKHPTLFRSAMMMIKGFLDTVKK